MYQWIETYTPPQLGRDEAVMGDDRRPGHLPQPRVRQLREPPAGIRPVQSASDSAGPPGTSPATSAGATYLRVVLRSTPTLAETLFFDRPGCQWTRISTMSITPKVLLAIAPPV